MARISLLSLNEENSDAESITDVEVLDNVAQAERSTSQADIVEQAIDDHEQLGKLAELVENSPEGVDPTTAAAVELAVESIRIRCGFSKPFKVATENFSSRSTRLNSSKELVQSIHSVQERLGKSISVAQEGMIDDIKFRLANMFTSTRGLRKRLVEAGTKYDNKGAKDVHEQIKCGGWGNRLNRDGKNILDGGIAIKYMTEAEKIITNSKFVGYVDISAEWMEQIKESVRDCWFFSSQKATDDILDVADEADKYLQKLKLETTQVHHLKNDEAYARALSPSEKEKLRKLTESILTSKSLDDAFGKFYKASKSTHLWILINSSFFRVGGIIGGHVGTHIAGQFGTAAQIAASAGNKIGFVSNLAAVGALTQYATYAGAGIHSDMRAAYKTVKKIIQLTHEIYNVVVLRDHICLAAVKYIEESTKTGRS